jgi:protoheme ferro-lyase
VETLGEIDHTAREEVRRLGIAQFEMSAGLNDSPKFIQALGQIVLQGMGESVQRFIPALHRGFLA